VIVQFRDGGRKATQRTTALQAADYRILGVHLGKGSKAGGRMLKRKAMAAARGLSVGSRRARMEAAPPPTLRNVWQLRLGGEAGRKRAESRKHCRQVKVIDVTASALYLYAPTSRKEYVGCFVADRKNNNQRNPR
jgi:hypothetical protein